MPQKAREAFRASRGDINGEEESERARARERERGPALLSTKPLIIRRAAMTTAITTGAARHRGFVVLRMAARCRTAKGKHRATFRDCMRARHKLTIDEPRLRALALNLAPDLSRRRRAAAENLGNRPATGRGKES